MQFRKSKELIKCAEKCKTCKCATKTRKCYIKNAIYEIQCQKCNLKYIGETSRTVKSRIMEHISDPKSAVYQHLAGCCGVAFHGIKWTILCISPNYNNRMATEAMYIQKNKIA